MKMVNVRDNWVSFTKEQWINILQNVGHLWAGKISSASRIEYTL